MQMRFQKWLFALAGVYGLVALLPLYWMEGAIATASPPAVTHVEYYYGFIGVAVCWQLVFLRIATNPLRFREFMPLAVLAKLAFGVAAVILYAHSRIVPETLAFGCADLALAVAFLIAYVRTPRWNARGLSAA
jgi:hypothetical protein